MDSTSVVLKLNGEVVSDCIHCKTLHIAGAAFRATLAAPISMPKSTTIFSIIV